jgi:hypothetical protein
MNSDPDRPAAEGTGDPLDDLLRSAQWPEPSDRLDDLLRMARWPEPAVDPLDRWLAKARWPEPAEELARCRAPWDQTLLLARKHRRRLLAFTGLAASLLAAVAFWGWQVARHTTSPVVAAKIAAGVPAAKDLPRATIPGKATGRIGGPASPAHAAAGISRPATPAEIRLFYRRLARQKARARFDSGTFLEAVVARRVAEPATDLQELTRPLQAERAGCEQRLLQCFRGLTLEQQAAAIDVLGCIGSEASTPLLLRASLQAALHGPAIRAIGKIGDAETIARLVPKEADAELQEEMLAALLGRGEPRAVAAYLDLVTRPGLEGRPMAALARVEQPPVEMLFQFLAGPKLSRRLAAALVLGRLDGPAITPRLIQLAAGGASRQEAMVALLASDNEDAIRFVQNARRSTLLAGVLSAANFQYRSLSHAL